MCVFSLGGVARAGVAGAGGGGGQAMANVRKQADAIAGAKDSVKAQSKILEKAEKRIADDKYKMKVNK